MSLVGRTPSLVQGSGSCKSRDAQLSGHSTGLSGPTRTLLLSLGLGKHALQADPNAEKNQEPGQQ